MDAASAVHLRPGSDREAPRRHAPPHRDDNCIPDGGDVPAAEGIIINELKLRTAGAATNNNIIIVITLTRLSLDGGDFFIKA